MQPYFSVIVPVYNEEGNLELLFHKLNDTFSELNKTWEVIFVNDGSTDKSEEELRKLAAKHSEVRTVSFTRNFGQTAAFAAGIDQARGEILITLDADLQNDPTDIPTMLEVMNDQNADIVAGWRKDRQDPFLRSLLSRVANKIINRSMNSEIHDLGCSLRLYKKSALKNLQLYGEMHRFIPILAASSGAKIVEMPVAHHPRIKGKSKYGLSRTFKVLLDMVTVKFLTTFQTKPIYMFGFAGIIFIIFSFIAAAWVIVRRMFFDGEWVSPMLFIMTILFNVGVICILMGLLAEIQVRTWFESSGKKSYVIKNIG
ncbi:MAG: glycosyltransferase family 2 protein [Patescibacteria group bacterium]|jgi:glycosyltransferase involved in cell wall biosynthesis